MQIFWVQSTMVDSSFVLWLLCCSQWVETSRKMKQFSGESDLSYRASFSFTEKARASGIRRRNVNLSHEISEISKRSGQFPELKKYNDFSVTAHPNLWSEWPLEAFIQEAWVCHAVPEPAWSYAQEFAVVQTKLRTCFYLFRTRTYSGSHHSIGSNLISAKPLLSPLVHHLKAWRKLRSEEGWCRSCWGFNKYALQHTLRGTHNSV